MRVYKFEKIKHKGLKDMKTDRKKLLAIIKDFYGDTSRSAKKTLNDLEEIRDELDMMIDTLKNENP